MRLRSRVAALAAPAIVCCLLAGCGTDHDAVATQPSPTAHATVGPQFYDTRNPPPPEGTITPAPGSWDGVHPPHGYRVVLVSMGTDKPTRTLRDAVEAWAASEQVELQHIVVDDHDQIVGKVTRAIELQPDLVISVGNDLIDPMAMITAAHLGQQFLVVGAELAEPTENVTAADWTGASFRGEGLGRAAGHDPTSFTPERTARAVRAGVAAVLSNHTGIVVWID
ncbi:type 1 periplasmic-binding domain-containing protein [Microlunatus soli]|uniref:hypothetical protein n=1 Tax=Microlunatus soli TaxID=630515 RepID=UPI0018D2EB20|nr:hypothetical protein [Microlunatus soli]